MTDLELLDAIMAELKRELADDYFFSISLDDGHVVVSASARLTCKTDPFRWREAVTVPLAAPDCYERLLAAVRGPP